MRTDMAESSEDYVGGLDFAPLGLLTSLVA